MYGEHRHLPSLRPTRTEHGNLSKNPDCRRRFTVAYVVQEQVQGQGTSVDIPSRRSPLKVAAPRSLIDPPVATTSQFAASTSPRPNSSEGGDILYQLYRFHLQLIKMKERKGSRLQEPSVGSPSGVTLHRVLAVMRINFDVTRPFTPNVNPPFSAHTLSEPATTPRLSQAVIQCRSFPVYSLTVRPTRTPSSLDYASSVNIPKSDYITITDVLKTIQSAAHEPLQTAEWNALGVDQKRKVAEAFDRRCRQAGTGTGETARKQGPRRVDWIVATRCNFLDGLMVESAHGGDQGSIEWVFRLRADRTKSKKQDPPSRLLKSRNIW